MDVQHHPALKPALHHDRDHDPAAARIACQLPDTDAADANADGT
jgi:hypothetical protein